MSVWMEKTVEWMWVVVSVFIMVLAVVFGGHEECRFEACGGRCYFRGVCSGVGVDDGGGMVCDVGEAEERGEEF